MEFKLEDIYDKNLNILIGSGASYGLFPTLNVSIKGNDGSEQTIETLATHFDQTNNQNARTLLLMHYFKTCVEPILTFDFTWFDLIGGTNDENAVIENYSTFLKTILTLLHKKKVGDTKTCNLFSTNYDNCIAYVADNLIKNGHADFSLNDGSSGFLNRYLSAKNYNTYFKHTGPFDRYSTRLPQINFIPLHGSGAWLKDGENIKVDYSANKKIAEKILKLLPDIKTFSDCLTDGTKKISDLEKIKIDVSKNKFLEEYNQLPIVNPTKWKFHETVFEEHYYQMLRFLSYELEKPNTILVTFGFSFKDEHILNLIKRSLSNPSLQVFVSCFNIKEHNELKKKFEKYSNVSFLTNTTKIDFSIFNENYFAIEPKSQIPAGGAT